MGKSTLAAALADALGWRHLSTDGLRKERYGLAPGEAAPPEAYAPGAVAAVYALLYDRTASILAAGPAAGVVADAVFARPDERVAIANAAARAGAGFRGLWLEARLSVRRDRVLNRPPGLSDATVAVVEAQEAYDLGDMPWRRLPAEGDSASLLRMALAGVRGARSG